MTTKKKRTAIVLTGALLGGVVLIGAGSVAARAWRGAGWHGPFAMGFHHGRLIEQLDLTPEQQGQLDRIHALLEAKHGESGSRHGDELGVLIDRIEGGFIDPAEVESTLDEHLERFRSSAQEVGVEVVTFINSLDEEQQAQLVSHLREIEERVGQRRSHFGRGSSEG